MSGETVVEICGVTDAGSVRVSVDGTVASFLTPACEPGETEIVVRTPGGEDVGAFTYLVATMRSMTELVILRTRTTLASDEAWLAAHRCAEGPTRAAGVAAVVTAAAVLLPVPVEAVMVIVMLGAVAMIGLVLYGAKVGTDAARETETPR